MLPFGGMPVVKPLDVAVREASGACHAGYLDSLGLRVLVRPVGDHTVPRLVQPSLRTNRFTRTTAR
jgi:predicted enzyme involved in methoxymalonyl-ACP biosynthesis